MVGKAVCELTGRLDGKVALVTGANAGIGLETTAELARRGAYIIMACRNKERAETAKAKILNFYGEGRPTVLTKNVARAVIKDCLGPVKPEQLRIEMLDLQSIASIRAFAQRVCTDDFRLNYLINNAGIMACPYAKTEDGFESQMGTNHIGHFLLTELLLPALRRAAPGTRIICLSSLAHKQTHVHIENLQLTESEYGPWNAYRRSKLANVLFAKELSKRLKDQGIIAVSVHPGVVDTELYKTPILKVCQTIVKPFIKNPWKGAQTTLYAVLASDLIPGGYYAGCALARTNALANDEAAAARLWTMTEEAIKAADSKKQHQQETTTTTA